MATLSLPTNSSSSSSSPAPTNSGSNTGGVFNNSGSLTSLYLYTFIATLCLLVVIFGALIARSMQLRRRRQAALLEAIAAGTPLPPTNRNGKRRVDNPLSKPTLWEVLIAPGPHDPEKGWGELLPVAGATLVPVVQQTPGGSSRRASWAPRRLSGWLGRGAQVTEPPATTPARSTTSLAPPSPPPPPSEPVCLAVLISMPSRTPRRSEKIGGAPVVEFGVTHVSYADSAVVS